MSSLSPGQLAHLDEQLARHGLERVADAIRPLAREAVHLTTGDPDDYSRTGGTRLGGVPDFPGGVRWPQAGRGASAPHLAFLAQINLGEMPRTVDGLLPAAGMLYFFSDSIGEDSVRVLYHAGSGSLFR